MRRALPFLGIGHDRRANAPYAVVAVMILLGAGMSYAYLAHLRTTRMEMEGLAPWSDPALDVLDREERRLEEVIRGILDDVVGRHDGAASGDLVSSIEAMGQEALTEWVSTHYPYHQGSAAVRLDRVRLAVSPIHGTVTTGNVLGQQMPQRLPVGLEAVGAATIDVTMEGGGRASRDVVVRVDRTEPLVLAAHLQDLLEYSLADEGLVPLLLGDAVALKLEVDPAWEPLDDTLEQMLTDAIATMQRSLFRKDTLDPWLWDDVDDEVGGHDLVGVGNPGAVSVEIPRKGTVTLTNPRTGETMEVRLVPWVRWGLRDIDLRISRLWSAEAGGPDGAILGRLDVGGRFDHTVDVWQGDRRLGGVTRAIAFRHHLTAWAEVQADPNGKEMRFGQAQVEDWDDLRRTMEVVSPPPREVVLDIDPAFGDGAELTLDGVPLGIVGTGMTFLRNVPAGPHHLLVRSPGPVGPGASYSEELHVAAEGPVPEVDVAPEKEQDFEAQYAFWFSLMSAFHRTDAGPVAHLEYIATLTGYPPLPEHIRLSPREHLGELAFWTQGLDRHMDYRGGQLIERGVADPTGTWELAKEVVVLSDLTIKLLVDLPENLVETGRVAVLLRTVEGRTEFAVQCQAASGTVDLIEGVDDGGECIVRFSTRAGDAVEHVGHLLSALAIIGDSLTIGFDLVELVEAVEAGDGARLAWALFDLQVDMAQIVISATRFLCDLGILAMSKVAQSVLTVVAAAVSVVATFMDAYREAGSDFWGAWDLLLRPGGFADALRTASFFSALASLVTTVVVTVTMTVVSGVAVASAFAFAVLAATGVGLIVLGVILAVWVILNWDQVLGWISGTAKEEDLDSVRGGVEDVLGSTMGLVARLNAVDVDAEVAIARSERGVGLALMHFRSTCGDAGLVDALGRADLCHLDGGSAQGRSARATRELRHWVEVLWRETDDLVDNDSPTGEGEHSEGFRDYKGTFGSQDHDFDADIRIVTGSGERVDLVQGNGSLVGFLRGLDPATAEASKVKLHIEGKVYKDAMKDWVKAIGAVLGQITEVSSALSQASRQSTFSASLVAEAAYSRERGIVEIRLPEGVSWARVEVECPNGAVVVGGEALEGPQVIEVTNGSALVTVTSWMVSSRILGYVGEVEADGLEDVATIYLARWFELHFGRSVLDHVDHGAD